MSGTDFLLGDFFSADGIYDPIQFVLTDRSGTQYRLDRRAGLLDITDRNGNTVSIGDDGVGASSGLSLGFVRDAQHRITRIDAPGGDIVYSYSPAGDLERVDYPDGTSQQFTYDAAHQLQSVTGGGQFVRTLHYDDDGRITAITDGNNVHDLGRHRRRRSSVRHHRSHGADDDDQHLRRPRQPREPGPGGGRQDDHDERHLRRPRPPADDDRRGATTRRR